MIVNIIHFILYIVINIIRLFKLTELYQPTYNPYKIPFVRSKTYARQSNDRLEKITSNIDLNDVSTYLDIGSQLGYFVFSINEINKSILSTGIEMNKTSYMYSVLIGILNKSINVSFINTELTSKISENIPSYDIISFLNVFHHIVHFQGFDEANIIMKDLYNKTNKYFIFETGQYNVKGCYWSNDLSFMGETPNQWLFDYLKSLGYSEVKLISKFNTHLNDEERSFFICIK